MKIQKKPICFWLIFYFFNWLAVKPQKIQLQAVVSDEDLNMITDEETGDVEEEVWLPRRSVRDTNWMYRVDALRTHDHREMEVKLHHSLALLCNALQALAYAFTFPLYGV